MYVKTIALVGLAVTLLAAQPVFAFGGGGGHRGGGGGGAAVAMAAQNGGGSTSVTASEPFAALAVGLGLLGARYLRRKK